MVNSTDFRLDINSITGMSYNEIIFNSIIALSLVILGIIIGKLVGYGLKKIISKLEILQKIRPVFISLFIGILRWSIYLIFFAIAIENLQIPTLSVFVSKTVIIIPAIVFSTILIAIGFSIATFLQRLIHESQIKEAHLLSGILFFFILLIFGIYALKVALLPFDPTTVNYLILVLTTVISIALAYMFVKKELSKH